MQRHLREPGRPHIRRAWMLYLAGGLVIAAVAIVVTIYLITDSSSGSSASERPDLTRPAHSFTGADQVVGALTAAGIACDYRSDSSGDENDLRAAQNAGLVEHGACSVDALSGITTEIFIFSSSDQAMRFARFDDQNNAACQVGNAISVEAVWGPDWVVDVVPATDRAFDPRSRPSLCPTLAKVQRVLGGHWRSGV